MKKTQISLELLTIPLSPNLEKNTKRPNFKRLYLLWLLHNASKNWTPCTNACLLQLSYFSPAKYPRIICRRDELLPLGSVILDLFYIYFKRTFHTQKVGPDCCTTPRYLKHDSLIKNIGTLNDKNTNFAWIAHDSSKSKFGKKYKKT